MNWLRAIPGAWHSEMNGADQLRVALAFGFLFGALSHFGWLAAHGSLLYHGPAPEWAVAFWFALCLIDFAMLWLLINQPKPGIIAACGIMAVSLAVNTLCFPTFEFGFNYVLVGLWLFGLLVFVSAPWLWRRSHWTPT